LLGATAAQLLLDEASAPGAHAHSQVVLQPELVVRASTVAPLKAALPRRSRSASRPREAAV
jgi:hypothetical protein